VDATANGRCPPRGGLGNLKPGTAFFGAIGCSINSCARLLDLLIACEALDVTERTRETNSWSDADFLC